MRARGADRTSRELGPETRLILRSGRKSAFTRVKRYSPASRRMRRPVALMLRDGGFAASSAWGGARVAGAARPSRSRDANVLPTWGCARALFFSCSALLFALTREEQPDPAGGDFSFCYGDLAQMRSYRL